MSKILKALFAIGVFISVFSAAVSSGDDDEVHYCAHGVACDNNAPVPYKGAICKACQAALEAFETIEQ